MIATIARRPLTISAANFFVFSAGSLEVSTFQPKSPLAAAVPADWSWDSSQKAPYATIWAQPAAGTLEIAASPFGTSANFRPAEGDKYPGSFPVISGVIYPIVASMDTRPCFSSVWRRRAKFSALPSAVKPAGSQKPTGSCTPSSFSKALNGEAVYSAQSPHAEPVSPSWKNIPMMAIIASLPLASSAESFLVFSDGSLEVSTLKPKSPAAAAVPADWSCDNSQNAPYATIWAQPAAGTLEMAARPLGMSANFRPAEGDKYPGSLPVISGVM